MPTCKSCDFDILDGVCCSRCFASEDTPTGLTVADLLVDDAEKRLREKPDVNEYIYQHFIGCINELRDKVTHDGMSSHGVARWMAKMLKADVAACNSRHVGAPFNIITVDVEPDPSSRDFFVSLGWETPPIRSVKYTQITVAQFLL